MGVSARGDAPGVAGWMDGVGDMWDREVAA